MGFGVLQDSHGHPAAMRLTLLLPNPHLRALLVFLFQKRPQGERP